MFSRLCYSFRKINSLVNISKLNSINMEKCYFRYIQKDDKIDISFLFKVNDTVRQFNLSRKPTESLELLCSRIGTNVQKFKSKKSKKRGLVENQNVKVMIYDNNNTPIPEKLSCMELFNTNTSIKLDIADQQYEAIFNAPWIVNYELPKSILMGFPVFPENFEAHYTDKNLSLFNWYRGKAIDENGKAINDLQIKWEFITNVFYYTPMTQDVGLKLKLEIIPKNSEATGPSVDLVSKSCVEAGPGPCPFETRHLFTQQKLKDKSFRCVSYNILADLYCDSDYTRTVLHPYCPPYALALDYRKQLILKELMGYNADILCLQEVDGKVFNNILTNFLEMDGLKGLFYKKGKTVSEGLAVFYRDERFRFLEDKQILLAEAIQNESCLKPIWEVVKNNSKLSNRLLDRSTVASATLLKSLDNENEILIVGNTHLYFHPDADHIRLIQGGIVISWLNDLLIKYKNQNPGARISLILCGDFNSVPSCGIYQLYTTGCAPSTLPDWKSNEDEAVNDLALFQETLLGSAAGTPQYTNFTEGFAECLDYIFYDKNNLEVEQVIPFPSVEELTQHKALPSIVFPSDHIAVVSDLRYK
ncbi:2',5'-phosphodiesterase 12 [Leptidea sinapis]|uniref:2',5'-phosphodiesterase 12 n=1 Tax=Leptidea sinapis TaxID=189913 RepID=UPI002133EB21|nr:2',5'-phosphodiesterase 12 [Leptidea sinapis]